MLDALFVYGSLMPHLESAFGAIERRRLGLEGVVVGPGRVAGVLYDLGDYPGLLADKRATTTVQGTLLKLSAPHATFAWLDAFEDIDASRPVDQQKYERVVVRCRLDDGRVAGNVFNAKGFKAGEIEAWVYAMRRVPPAAKLVASGMWHAPSP